MIFNIKAWLWSNVAENKKLEMYVKEIMCILQKNLSQEHMPDSTFLTTSVMLMNPIISVRQNVYIEMYIDKGWWRIYI